MPRTGRKDILLGVISKKDAENLLVDLVNFTPQGLSDPSFERLFRRWGTLFPGYEIENDGAKADLYSFLTLQLAEALRTAWSAPNLREREWHANRVRQVYNENRVDRSEDGKRLLPLTRERKFHGGSRSIVNDLAKITKHRAAVLELERLRKAVPPINPFDAAVQHFQHILDRASQCQNPVCHTPYFLAAKFGQKFCSGPCARPAQQEAKRRWWNQRGAEWRSQNSNLRKVGK